jgi:Tfp pilus assembly protein PilN
MSSELTNLLPAERIRGFRREYFFRLGTLAVSLFALSVIVHGVLLIPSYLYVNGAVSVARDQLGALTQNLVSSGEGEMRARLGAIKKNSDELRTLLEAPSAAEVFKALLAVPDTGVTITGLTFSTPAPEGRVTIVGVASTREALRQYHRSLSSLSFAKSADLPLSAYAKESDIPFTITLTGSFKTP